MSIGLGARLAIAFAVLAATTALITAGITATSTNRRVNQSVDDFLTARAISIAEGTRRAPEGGRAGRSPQPRLAAIDDDVIVQVLDRSGEIRATTGLSLPIEADDLEHLAQSKRITPRSVKIDGGSYRIVTVHQPSGGAIQVAQNIDSTQTLLGSVRSEVLLVGAAMSGIAGLIGWFIASRTTRPLRRLTSTIESVAHTQDLTTPVRVDGDDEVGRLSESFDQLLANLATSREQQHQLVHDAAHELRTPLTSVRANIDFLDRAPELDAQTRSTLVHSIKSELAVLSNLVAEVVELATESRDTAMYVTMDLAVAAEAAIAQFELRSSRPVIRELSPTEIKGDHATLVRAIANLIANADKYTPDTSAPIHVRTIDQELVVADRGPGISVEDREQIFNRFWRADKDRSTPGSGLGLAIVEKAVTEHGGSVFARGRDGGGSEIGFSL